MQRVTVLTLSLGKGLSTSYRVSSGPEVHFSWCRGIFLCPQWYLLRFSGFLNHPALKSSSLGRWGALQCLFFLLAAMLVVPTGVCRFPLGEVSPSFGRGSLLCRVTLNMRSPLLTNFRHSYHTHKKIRAQRNLEVMDMFITLVVVMILWVCLCSNSLHCIN